MEVNGLEPARGIELRTGAEVNDVIVVGGGLMGMAAARFMSESGASVTVFAPEEGNPDRVHASHYDEARIVRGLGPDLVWSRLALDAMTYWDDIARRTGLAFHRACGHLRLFPRADDRTVAVDEVARSLDPPVVPVDQATVRHTFPFLAENVFHTGYLESGEASKAGIINPRLLLRAQRRLTKAAGGVIVDRAVSRVSRTAGSFEVADAEGAIHKAPRVLVATGAYTTRLPLTPFPLQLDVRPETVLLVQVDESDDSLDNMPGIIWQFADHPFLREAYILPPVHYPDDKRWVKIGADHDRDVAIPDVESMHTYMTSAGSAATAEALSDLINRLIPALCGQARHTKPCLLTYTSSGYPTIDELERNWFVAAGGCGKSAKSSVQLGRMAADLVLEDRWDANYERTLFRSSTHGSRSI